MTTWFLIIFTTLGATNIPMESRTHCQRAATTLTATGPGLEAEALCISSKGVVWRPGQASE